MEKSIRLEKRPDGVGVVWIDVPKEAQNTIKESFRDELALVLREIVREGLTAVVVASKKEGSFIAGADIEMLQKERVHEPEGFRHVAPGQMPEASGPARGHDRWVINKLRALCSWYTKGLDGGSALRVSVNQAASLPQLHAIIEDFFLLKPAETVGV